MKRVLIIDALNAYLRAYIVDPSLSTNGQPIGGLKGFIKILQKLARETRPDNIIIAWDGPDGSRKRKIMDKNYKAGRKPIRLNRAIRNLTEDEELQNKMTLCNCVTMKLCCGDQRSMRCLTPDVLWRQLASTLATWRWPGRWQAMHRIICRESRVRV